MNAHEIRGLASALTGEDFGQDSQGLRRAAEVLGARDGRAYLCRPEYLALCRALVGADGAADDASVRKLASLLRLVGRDCRRAPDLADKHRACFRTFRGIPAEPPGLTIVFLDMFRRFPDAVEACLGTEFSGSFALEFVSGRIDLGAVDLGGAAVVSPANGLGYMRGGIDGAYAKMFAGVELEVQAAMRASGHYPLPVGMAVSVPVGAAAANTWLISAPTMATPGKNVASTNNAERAFLAALGEFDRLSRERGVTTLVCPGLATGVGGMSEHECARQIRAALRAHRSRHD